LKSKRPQRWLMTSADDLASRRAAEAIRISTALSSEKGLRLEEIEEGEHMVAWVTEKLCIGCDHCTIACDDDAIELYHKDMISPMMNVPSNRKARILRDPCTGCRLCVLACPTDAIEMIER
jgi:Na+-translocating ferredoxin:NAD+ oxidoreductase RNF subunit RnfB